MVVVQALERALASATDGGPWPYLIIDGAQAEGSNAMLDRWGVRYLSLFEGTPEESLPEIAPLLVPLQNVAPSRRKELLAWAQEFAFSAPAISWITSEHEPQRLADHLRRFHVVGLTEGQSMLLRWYDTRILPILLGCLTPAQHAAFAAGMLKWDAVDRTGAIVTLVDTATPTAQPDAPRFGARQITLDNRQYALLVDASALDGLLRQLRRVIPDELKRVPQKELTSFVSHCLELALAAGLNDLDRQTQFTVLGLYTSGRAYEQPEFKRFMTKPPESLDAFYKGIQALSDDVWNAGPPLWESSPAAAARTPA
jgi:hypothetical protein